MEALYHSTLERSGEERKALLGRADPEVRRAVEGMLLQEESGVGMLDCAAWELATDVVEPPAELLAPGERVGPYRIDAHIGSGGMGEVYRATDERLTRTVAIKIAPAQFSDRFEREAKAIAAFNHPFGGLPDRRRWRERHAYRKS